MATQRVSPRQRDNARKELVGSLARSKTGDPEMDEAVGQMVRRNAFFSTTNRVVRNVPLARPDNPFTQIGRGLRWLRDWNPWKQK